jgi:hypothetical protein
MHAKFQEHFVVFGWQLLRPMSSMMILLLTHGLPPVRRFREHAGKVKKFSSSSWCYARKIQLKLNSLFTTKPLEPSRERLYW